MAKGQRRPPPKRFELPFYNACAVIGFTVVVFGLLTRYKDGVAGGVVGGTLALVQIWRIKTDRPDPKWLQPQRDRTGGGSPDGRD